MSKTEKIRWQYKLKLKKLSIEHTKAQERLAVKIGLIAGSLFLLIAVVITIFR